MDSPVADWVNGHSLAAAAALGNGVVPFSPSAKRPGAQEAARLFLRAHRFSQWSLAK